MRRFDAEALTEFVVGVLRDAGLAAGPAARTGELIVAADTYGVHTHGVDLLPEYHEGFRIGELSASAEPHCVRRHGAVSVFDAVNGLGYEASRMAMEAAIEAAASHGVGIASVRNSNHFGMAAHWTRQAVAAGMIGFATTNGPPVTGPWGGRDVLFSNNPLSWGIPTKHQPAVIFDVACTAAARGKVRLAAQRGEDIPAGWALDDDGRPTTDPIAALDGLLLPFAGHKGSGLALIDEILSGPLSGARTLTEIPALTMSSQGYHGSWRCGHFFMALDPAAFGDRDQILERIDEVVERVRSVTPAEGFDRVRTPGERSSEAHSESIRLGVTLPDAVVSKIERLAHRLGLAVPSPLPGGES